MLAFFFSEFVPRRVKPIDKKRIHVCACAINVFKMMRKVFANVTRRNWPDLRVCPTRKQQNRSGQIDDYNKTESNVVLLLCNTTVDWTEILSVDFELIPDVVRTGITSYTQEHVRQTNTVLANRGKTQIRNGQSATAELSGIWKDH